ncbi:MAG: glycosyltransferase family 4 protein, partial [Flavisolibacter sp.]|nr:glycosyltransferase family 4 protein [Flavisolibacter sp.]
LYKGLKNDQDLTESLDKHADKVLFLEPSLQHESLKVRYRYFILQYTKPGDIFHFIGEHPFLVTRRNKQVYSITQSSLKNLNLFGRIGHFLGAGVADIVDILDPGIYKKMRNVFFYKKRHIYRTSNSFCNIHLFTSPDFNERSDWLVFLGRFEPVKQVQQLLQAVPAMYHAIRQRARKDLHFYFLGYGSQDGELRQILRQEAFRDIPATISFNDKPYEILSKSKIFFSLQLHNNYPSKSLIEAMAAGNIPVVTDIGETRWLAKPEFSYYVPEKFTSQDLAETVRLIYSTDDSRLAVKSKAARQAILDGHTIDKMLEYYLNLYQTVSGA